MSNTKPHDPRTKTEIIRGHMAGGDWRNAIRVAARLPRLDKHRAAILDAQGAYENPGFYTQIGKDPTTLVEAGAVALRERFSYNQESKTMTTAEKTYSKASNARRAAKAAGLSEFDVYKVADGTYKIRSAAIRAAMAARAPGAEKTKEATVKAVKPVRANVSTKAPKQPKEAKPATRPQGKRAAVMAAAQAGKLPPPLDFSAPTHARYRDTAEELVALAKAGNLSTLKRLNFKTYSSSPKAMAKYRDLVVIALEARAESKTQAA